jgi:hypothetical protein
MIMVTKDPPNFQASTMSESLQFINQLVGARDLRPLWSPPVSLNLVHVLKTFNFLIFMCF